MKKKGLWLGILVMVQVFGMMVVGCDDEEIEPIISINGTPIVGETLTAIYSGSGEFGYFEWCYAMSQDADNWQYYITDFGKKSLQLDKRYANKYIKLGCIYSYKENNKNKSKKIYSNIIGPVQP